MNPYHLTLKLFPIMTKCHVIKVVEKRERLFVIILSCFMHVESWPYSSHNFHLDFCDTMVWLCRLVNTWYGRLTCFVGLIFFVLWLVYLIFSL